MAKILHFPSALAKPLRDTMINHMVDEIMEEVEGYFKERGYDLGLLVGFRSQVLEAVSQGVPHNVTFKEFDQLKSVMSGRWLKILNIDND